MELSVEPSVTSYDAAPGIPLQGQLAPPYSLMILIKLLELNNGSENEQYTLSLQCGEEADGAIGTLAMLNTAKPGIVVSLQEDAKKFTRFLTENSVQVCIKQADSTTYKGVLQLKDTQVMAFDPKAENGTPVVEQFPVLDDSSSEVGTVTMILQVVRSVSPADPMATVDVMYRINDHKLKTAEQQEADVRTLLICPNCSMPRASADSCCGYEIVDGILNKKMVSSTEQMIERIKEKINQVKLDDAIGQPDSTSDIACEKFCSQCGGLTITGATCTSAAPNSSGARPSNMLSKAVCHEDLACGKVSEGGPSFKKPTKSSIRCCERCKACLDWLPEACCCPRCGYKPKKQESRSRFSLPPYFEGQPDVGQIPKKHSSSLRGSDTMVASSESCRLCNICKSRCIDCANLISLNGHSTPSTFSSVPLKSKIEVQQRPITRRPWRKPQSADAVKSDSVILDSGKGKRKEEMQQVYGAKGKPEPKQTVSRVKPRLTAKQIRKQYTATIKKIKRQNRNLYSYRFGKRHPGIVVGHRTCMKQDPLVPPHMGWQWDVSPPGISKQRPGWRPGAVRKPIMQLMQHFLKCYPLDNVPVSKKKSVSFPGGDATQGLDPKQRPTLHIIKKNGEYAITMNPLKDSETLKTTDDPYLPCKPIKFKLAKDPQRTKLYLLRDALKRKGLPVCGCKDLANCDHCTEREKRLLTEEIRRSAKVLGLSAKTSIGDIPSGSESELDVEFTPPSAIIRPDMKRPDVVVAETQYNVQDFQLKPMVDERDGKAKVRGHGKGDGASKGTVGGKNVNVKGGATAGGKKTAGGAPDAPNTKVRISVTKAKGSAIGTDKGPTGKGNKNTSGSSQGQQGRPGQAGGGGGGGGGGTVGEGTGNRTNKGTTDGKRTGNGDRTKVYVQQRSALSKGKQIGMDSTLVCDRIPTVPQPLMVGCCPTVTYCCYPTQCIP